VDFDERAALDGLSMPRLAFAGENDTIAYGPKWDNAVVAIAEPLRAHRDALAALGWTVELLPDADHMSGMHAARVLPILTPWLTAHARP
jgi:hypothetical protein